MQFILKMIYQNNTNLILHLMQNYPLLGRILIVVKMHPVMLISGRKQKISYNI